MTQTQATLADPAGPALSNGHPALANGEGVGEVSSALVEVSSALSGERAREADRLVERWRARRFVVLVAGEFKRGKSTLLNALVGADVLPTGVLPVTAIPTRVAAGPRGAARVHFRAGGKREIRLADVRDYVDESRNPENRLGVASVDVELPADLPPGVVLVDVPGLGSVHRHNSESALAALPEADAALVVVSVDPPIGQAELRLLERLRRHVARLDVVLNKIDYLDEPARRAAEGFTRDVLTRHGFEGVLVWPLSARAGLLARLSGDNLGWRRSGLQALDDSLRLFLGEERERLLARSLARKAARLVEQEIALVDVRTAAARHTSTELRALIGTFSERQATSERDTSEALLIFGRRFDALFAGYAERAATAWRARRVTLDVRLAAIVRGAGGESRTAVWKELRTAGSASVEAFLDGFLADESAQLHAEYERLRGEVVVAAAQRAEAVWRMAAELLSFDPPRVDASALPAVARPVGLQLEAPRLMLEDLEDAFASFLPRQMALRHLAARALAEADDRYGRAVEQTRDHFIRAYDADFRSLLGRFEKAGAETASAIAAALRAAQTKVEELGAGAAASASAEDSRREGLGSLLAALRGIGGEA